MTKILFKSWEHIFFQTNIFPAALSLMAQNNIHSTFFAFFCHMLLNSIVQSYTHNERLSSSFVLSKYCEVLFMFAQGVLSQKLFFIKKTLTYQFLKKFISTHLKIPNFFWKYIGNNFFRMMCVKRRIRLCVS